MDINTQQIGDQETALGVMQEAGETVDIPRNWSSCVVTFPGDIDQRIIHTVLCGVGHVVTRNAARQNGYSIMRDPSIESHSFFRGVMMSVQKNHGATVEVFLDDRMKNQSKRQNGELNGTLLLNMTRGFVARMREAFTRN